VVLKLIDKSRPNKRLKVGTQILLGHPQNERKIRDVRNQSVILRCHAKDVDPRLEKARLEALHLRIVHH
jgi:hypothetical protein